MTDNGTDRELLLRYIDGRLIPAEEKVVTDSLRTDPAAREFLRDVAEQAVALADMERAEQGRQAEQAAKRYETDKQAPPASGTEISLVRLVRWPLAIATAAVIVLMTSLYFRPDSGQGGYDKSVVTITGLNGATQWTGDGGQVDLDLKEGQALRGGTLETLSTNSWVEIQYPDKSMVTISGRSVLTIAARDQKELHLGHGNLSADVKPQQPGTPMLIHTPTAKLEVLGTQFNVDTEAATTLLTVNKGRVRVTRLVDGMVKEVPADHQVTAAASRAKFNVALRPAAVKQWKSNLPQNVIYGKWMPETASLRATPLLWREGKEKPTLLYAASMSVSRGEDPPVVLSAGARFRIRGRMESDEHLLIGLTTKHPKGGFAGKYESWRPAAAFLQSDQLFDLEVRVEDFKPQEPRYADSPIGLEVFDWWCLTINVDAGLTITSVELIPADSHD
ncbi:MAG TPA: hypothetical protein EYG57_18435 [Planctomycetes bacterium]|nr:hypothetical protein [Planctomycetota bacterium]